MVPTYKIDIDWTSSQGLTIPADSVLFTKVYDRPDESFNFPCEIFAWASQEAFDNGYDPIVYVDDDEEMSPLRMIYIVMQPNQSYDVRALIMAELEDVFGTGNVTDLLI